MTASAAGVRIADTDPGQGEWMTPEELTRADPERFRNAGWVVIDHPGRGLRGQLTRIHRLDPTVQVIVLAGSEARAEAERTLLFTPGVGEVWVADPEEIDDQMLRRAADVTRRRRRFRRTRATLDAGLRRMGPTKSERAQVSDAFLAALLEVVPDPVLSLATDGRIVSANPAAGRLTDRPVEALEGRQLTEVLEAHDREALETLLHRGGEAAARGEILFRHGNGDPGVAEVVVTPVQASKHEIRCVILHDVTEERRVQGELARQAEALEEQAAELEEQAAEQEATNLELQERTDELEQAMESRSRFYAAMSHELRTPLNAIIGYNALVLDGVMGDLPEKMKTSLQRSQRAAHHLLELVNDVLDLAKIEAGRIEMSLEPVTFPQILEELADTVGPMAREHGSDLTLEGPDKSHRIVSDPRRVRQILLNLLSNAIKFGEGEPVRVSWSPEGGGGVCVEVADRGIGIAPDSMESIFEEFTQFDQNSGGTGLGLTISRRLALALGGRLRAESEVGVGSTFRLHLPARAPASAQD